MPDAASKPNVYQPVQIQVSNAQAGQNIAVNLQADGPSVGWSTGPDLKNIAGIEIAVQSGSLPMLAFDVNAATMFFSTSSDGSGAISFTVSAYLVGGAGIQTFYMASSSAPGVEVTAAIGDSEPQAVNPSLTLFDWNPI